MYSYTSLVSEHPRSIAEYADALHADLRPTVYPRRYIPRSVQRARDVIVASVVLEDRRYDEHCDEPGGCEEIENDRREERRVVVVEGGGGGEERDASETEDKMMDGPSPPLAVRGAREK